MRPRGRCTLGGWGSQRPPGRVADNGITLKWKSFSNTTGSANITALPPCISCVRGNATFQSRPLSPVTRAGTLTTVPTRVHHAGSFSSSSLSEKFSMHIQGTYRVHPNWHSAHRQRWSKDSTSNPNTPKSMIASIVFTWTTSLVSGCSPGSKQCCQCDSCSRCSYATP